jgi:transcriptional regulator with XRE-family HTH domain
MLLASIEMPKISLQYVPVKRAMITAAQIRAARGLLNLSQAQLADMAELGIATIKRIEASSEVRGAASTLWKIQAALEAAGIEFLPAEDGGGLGVRLRPGSPKPRRKT